MKPAELPDDEVPVVPGAMCRATPPKLQENGRWEVVRTDVCWLYLPAFDPFDFIF